MENDRRPRKLSKEALKRRQIKNTAVAIAALDIDGYRLVRTCSHCGAVNVRCHERRTSLCVTCGRLYERWRKALRHSDYAELSRLKPVLLDRYAQAKLRDREAAARAAEFFERVKQTEVTTMGALEKRCKQCGRTLAIENFRAYKPRGRGVYNTTQGSYTICRTCEAINSRAITATKNGDEAALEKLKQHYQALIDIGLPPVTAAAKRLMAVDTQCKSSSSSSLDSLLREVHGTLQSSSMLDEANEHCRLVRERGYASFNEADEVHQRLTTALKELGLYAEINNLMDAWFEEGA